MNPQTPTVDVVIPTYNQAEYLRKALQSLVDQEFHNWNALVVNNMSTDNTRAVVEEFNDPRISIIDFANHGVIAASRNIGITRSNATYLAFLDSDDWWFPNKLHRCIASLEAGFDLVCHAEEWRSTTASRRVLYGPASRANYQHLLLHGNCLSTSAVVGRTAMFQQVGGFATNPEFVTAEDYELWLRLAERQFSFAFLPEILGVFRIHPSSASSSVERNCDAEMAVVKHHLTRANITSRRRVRRRQARSHYSAGRAHHKNGSLQSSWPHFRRALWLSPSFVRAYAGVLILVVSSAKRKLFQRSAV